jgi:RHS repeat-associated protein
MGAGTTAGNASQLMSVTGTIGGGSESASFTYDLVWRLTTSNQTSNGQNAQRRFAYDRWGNRTAVYDPGNHDIQIQAVTLEQSGGAPTNRITSVTGISTVNYSYDASGNMTSDGLHSYTYDSEDRLVSVDSGATAQYSYDHQNRRYKKTIGSTVTHYVWENGKVLGEYNGSTGTLQVNYWYAGKRMFKKTGVTTQVFLSDRLSIRLALSNIGVVAGRQGHLPFGEDFAESGTQEKHHFTSYERDIEIGTDYAVNRQYSAAVARFHSTDPHKTSELTKSPQSWSRYTYVLSDPVNKTDPLGLLPAPPGDSDCGGDPGDFWDPIVGFLCQGTTDCSFYDRKCKKILKRFPLGHLIAYYCFAAPRVCAAAGDTRYVNCVRLCLQQFDICSRIFDPVFFLQCQSALHAACFELKCILCI